MLSDDDLRKNIRNNLTAMRMAKGLTQTEVGKIVGKKSNSQHIKDKKYNIGTNQHKHVSAL